MSLIDNQTEHQKYDIAWVDQGNCVVSFLDGMRLCVEKLPNRGKALTSDQSVVRLMPRQYRATVDKITANPKCPIRTDIELSKRDAVEFALELPKRISARREVRRAELLAKLSLPTDAAD